MLCVCVDISVLYRINKTFGRATTEVEFVPLLFVPVDSLISICIAMPVLLRSWHLWPDGNIPKGVCFCCLDFVVFYLFIFLVRPG